MTDEDIIQKEIIDEYISTLNSWKNEAIEEDDEKSFQKLLEYMEKVTVKDAITDFFEKKYNLTADFSNVKILEHEPETYSEVDYFIHTDKSKSAAKKILAKVVKRADEPPRIWYEFEFTETGNLEIHCYDPSNVLTHT